MTLKGETILTGAPGVCPDCEVELKFEVLRSNAGYYIGTMCDCGPYSRESEYFVDRGSAETALELWQQGMNVGVRNTEFVPGEIEIFEITPERFELDIGEFFE